MAWCSSLNHEEALKIIVKIDTLTSLNLAGWKMGSLPEGFGNLTALTSLNLQYCPAKLTATMEEQLKAQGCSIQT